MSDEYKFDEKTGTYVRVDQDQRQNPSMTDQNHIWSKEEEKIAVIVIWASQFLNFMLLPIVVPILAYMYFKGKSIFIYETSRHVVNFLISAVIYAAISSLFLFVGIGYVMIILVGVYCIMIPILGILNAVDFKNYKPQLTIEFIK